MNLKKELLQKPRKNQQPLLFSIENLLSVLKTESDKQRKKENDLRICPHSNLPKIAKGMCFNCYNKKGKTKMATKCEHTDQFLYCQGLC